MPFPFTFAWLNALHTVRHSHRQRWTYQNNKTCKTQQGKILSTCFWGGEGGEERSWQCQGRGAKNWSVSQLSLSVLHLGWVHFKWKWDLGFGLYPLDLAALMLMARACENCWFNMKLAVWSQVRPRRVRPLQWQIKGCQTTEPRTFDSGFSGKVNLSTLNFTVYLCTYFYPVCTLYYLVRGYPLSVWPSLTLPL